MRIVRTFGWSRLEGDREDVDAAFDILDRDYTYAVPGAWYSPAFKRKAWDGKVHLIRKRAGGAAAFPSGLHREISTRLRRAGFDLELEDRRPDNRDFATPVEWTGPKLRGYQEEAVQSALDSDGGIIKLPIRAGKTIVAARIMFEMGTRAIFVVPSDLLVRQSFEKFKECLTGATVSVWDGITHNESDVVVVTIQTLNAVASSSGTFDPSLLDPFGVCFFDETHHLTGVGDAWRKTALGFPSRVKFGLSATVEVSNRAGKAKMDKAAIWLRGICGPKLVDLSTSALIEAGFLVRPTIRFVRHNAPEFTAKEWSEKLYREAIAECKERNERIVEEATSFYTEGRRVLIDVSRVYHAELLVELLRREVGEKTVTMLVGRSSREERERGIALFIEGVAPIIVGTILGEGVDIPAIDVVINAEGGKAKVSTVQRLRNLTLKEGKEEAITIEFVDDHNPRFKKWTLDRLRIYRGEPAFRIEVEATQ